MSDEPATTPVRKIRLAAAVIVLAALAAYGRTFSAPFIFDDIPAITQNPQIRHLADLGEVLRPTRLNGSGAAGRPLVNLSLAINYAISGERVWSYHALNLLIHLGAGLALFGVLRRTFRQPVLATRFGDSSLPLALGGALLWTLHPLQTESVTCVVQRTESQMGWFYLLTLYAFIRSTESRMPGRWQVLSWTACALGMVTKEVMVSAPLVVLLYDRTFVAGSFREAWRQRAKQHLALAATWSLLAAVVLRSEGRGGTVGFGHGVAGWEYLLTQCRAIAFYLRLSLWPHPLVLDYGTAVVRTPLAVLPQGLLLLALGAGTVFALWRRPVIGFIGAWFFLILVPSSSVVPLVTQTIAEHRMYLPLAAVVVLIVGVVHALAGRRSLVVLAALAVVLGLTTYRRNGDYLSAEGIWRDTIAKQPSNERAHYGLAMICDEQGRLPEAIASYESALRLKPDYVNAHSNLAHDLVLAGRPDEAIVHYQEAGRLEPGIADSHIHLGVLHVRLGHWEEAIREYDIVLRLLPQSAEDHFNIAQALLEAGRLPEAIRQYELSVQFKPDSAPTHFRLGNARLRAQQLEGAVAAYREAVRLDPAFYEAQVNLGGALLLLNRAAEAVAVYEQVLRLRPGDTLALANLERAKARLR